MRFSRSFLGVDHLQGVNATLFALLPHHLGQWTNGRLIDICHLEFRRVNLVAGAHGRDHRYACRLGLFDNGQLAGDGIDGIHHIVVLGKIEPVLGLRKIEALVGAHVTVRVDVMDTVRCHLHLVATDACLGGNNLAVDVGAGYGVIVHKVQRSHTGSRQRLYHVSSHAADAEDKHAAIGQAFHSFCSIYNFRSAKLF